MVLCTKNLYVAMATSYNFYNWRRHKMGQYLLIFRGGGFESREGTNEDQSRLNSVWDNWRESLGQNLISPGSATAIAATAALSGKLDLAGDRITAFCVISSDTIDNAVEIARRTPTVVESNGQVDVYELFDASKTVHEETEPQSASIEQYAEQAQTVFDKESQSNANAPDLQQVNSSEYPQSTEADSSSSSADDGTLEVHPEDHQQD